MPGSLLVGFSSQRTFTFHGMPPTLSFCAKPKAKSQNLSSKNNPRHSGEGGPLQTVGEGRGRALSPIPHPPWRAPYPQGGGYLSLSVTLDSATSGKDCVQNDRMVSWEIVRRIQFNKVCSYKLQKWTDFVLYPRHEPIKNQLT